MANLEYFTQDGEILGILKDLKDAGIDKKQFSDVISKSENGEELQYVDLVQEGGGTLGVALLGYTYILERLNIRFLQLAGTSAGAINTMLMAAGGSSEQIKSTWILEKMNQKSFYDFVDGDKDAREFIDTLLKDSSKVKMAWKGIQVIDNFNNDLGLNSGNNFHSWLTTLLNEKGIKTYADLQTLRRTQPSGGFKLRQCRLDLGETTEEIQYERIAIVTADISTESKIIFPEMSELYWADTSTVNPADFVRASMSIPFFFHPFKVSNIPTGEDAWSKWDKHTGFRGNRPKDVYFIDGGIMSNFPIDLFHNFKKVPKAPTFGVKLGVDRTESNKNDSVLGLIGSIFDSARHVHDFDFLFRNPEYKKLISIIDTGNHNWLNFKVSDEEKLDLFKRGARAASDFLQKFNWQDYKAMRGNIAKIYI